MKCPLCGARPAKRHCPAKGQRICAVCCGTKRLVEIACPQDCVYLASAREHPAAVIVRRQQHDVSVLMHAMRDLNQRQARLFLFVSAAISSYRAPDLEALYDEDVAEAMASMASTYETASRGVIYDHRPASRPAERLVAALKAALVEQGRDGGSSFERDAALVLRRTEEAVKKARSDESRRAYLDLLGRTLTQQAPSAGEPKEDGPRLIVP